MKRAFALCAVVVAACSLNTDNSQAAVEPPGPTDVAMTFTGEVSGTVAGLGSFHATNGPPRLVLVGPSVVFPPFNGTIQFIGTPSAGTYTETDVGVVGTIFVNLGTRFWAAGSSPTSRNGTFTLTLTTVSPPIAYTGGTAYTFSGTLDARMRALGTTDTSVVTVHAKF
jgi:hypothetical protein